MPVGTALFPSATTWPGTDVYPGQGNTPCLVARIGFEAASTPDPLSWVDVSARVRAFEVNRGGENELELIDTGTAQVTLDNRDRALDPFNTSSAYSPNVLPRRRLWLQGQWDGETHDLFYGWTGAFKPAWSNDSRDAIVELRAQDGFACLAKDNLPVSSPPRDSYQEHVRDTNPTGYWHLDEQSGALVAAEAGPSGVYTSTPTFNEASPVAGGVRAMSSGTANIPTAITVAEDVFGLFRTLRQFTVKIWVTLTADLSGTETVMAGPTGTPSAQPVWDLRINSSEIPGFNCIGSVTVLATPATPLSIGVPHMLVGRRSDTEVSLWVDGVEVDTSTGAMGNLEAWGSETLRILSGSANVVVDEPAVYSFFLPDEEIVRLYNAGINGLPRQLGNDRVDSMLAASSVSFLPRRLRTATRQVESIFYAGQPPKDEVGNAVKAEGDPSLFFFGKDGAAVFLDRSYRTVSPWNTVQATFDDDGTDLPYLSLEIDDGEAFIYNDVRVTAANSTMQQSVDATSQAAYWPVVLDRGQTLNVSDTDADAEADALLAKYKDPIPRVTAIHLEGESDIAVLGHMIERELGDRVRIIRRPVGGGSAIDEEMFIRKIQLSGSSDDPHWSATWSVAGR